jgi:hypothetical protein
MPIAWVQVESSCINHHHKKLILTLAQVSLWVPDLSDTPVAQSLNRSVGHASAANHTEFARRENQLTGLRSELSPYVIIVIRLEVVTKLLFPSR